MSSTKTNKVWRIKTPIVTSNHHQKQAGVNTDAVASVDHCTTSQHNENKAGANAPVTNSGDIEQPKDEKQTLISLHQLNIVPKKKLLVIPLRGILVHRAHLSRELTISKNRRPDFCYGNFLVYKRPYCVDFMKFCFQRFHVGLWSSAIEKNLQGILTNVMGDLKNKFLFTWDQEHCTDSGFMCLDNKDKPLFLKELNHLWEKKYPNLPWCDGEYSASNTLLITTPEKTLLNPPNTAIYPLSYDPKNKKDDFLGPKGDLRVFLEGLADAEDVQTYVQDHPIGEPEIMPSHPDWEYYCKIICALNKNKTDQSLGFADLGCIYFRIGFAHVSLLFSSLHNHKIKLIKTHHISYHLSAYCSYWPFNAASNIGLVIGLYT
ncbi:hypothetical protein QVD17_14701 [Tagetes erecta]|uniref:Mitochondrial import inner membrane translocase subunit TIM50 n=1 Tax=Tagetes erecta TaxID=13708 RepID=A0AAD8NYY0_TARER|nr:hypothetical protein QVD17_14701 [Tagetes erecta]